MRFVRLALSPSSGSVHPVGEALDADPGIDRKAIVYLDAFADGTGVLVYRLGGTRHAIDAVLDDQETVRRYDVSCRDDECYAYAYVDPGEPAGTLVSVVQRHALVVETPLSFCTDGTIKVTVAGHQSAIRSAFAELTDRVPFEVRSTGEYDPIDDGVITQLTSRQWTVLETAVELGYYEVPRQATHADVAEAVGCATSTVDEHLRKAESTIFDAILR